MSKEEIIRQIQYCQAQWGIAPSSTAALNCVPYFDLLNLLETLLNP